MAALAYLCVAFWVCPCFAQPPRNKPQGVVSENGEQLAGTELMMETDSLSDRVLDGASRFLDQKLTENTWQTLNKWRDLFELEPQQLDQQIGHRRDRLRYLAGAADPRATPRVRIDYESLTPSSLSDGVTLQQIHWTVFENYSASGLRIANLDHKPKLNLIWIPDTLPHLITADSSPEIAIEPNVIRSAVRLAEAGVQVFIVYPFSNIVERRGNRIDLTDREYAYRTLFVLGRHPVGIEVQSIQALADWLNRESKNIATTSEFSDKVVEPPLCIAGDGDSGLSALIAAATDERFSTCIVQGDFGNRAATWTQPISRNIFGLISEFGDAQLACLIRPRTLIVDPSPVAEYTISNPGAAPGIRTSPTIEQTQAEISSVESIIGEEPSWLQLANNDQKAVEILAKHFDLTLQPASDNNIAVQFPVYFRDHQLSQIESLSDHWIQSSRELRKNWSDKLDTSSLATYQTSIAPQRARFENEIIGSFVEPLLAADAKSRLWKTTDRWTGWELEVDVFPGFVAGGILLVPHEVSPSAPRPAVVCVHGLEGNPLDTIEGDHRAYRDFARKLCEQGFVVFCPQQLYLGKDRFRVLQRKANPLGKTLFSLMIAQHKQLLGYLKTLPYVDAEKIAFYGLSYGGKSAMRIPAVIEDYCAVICSGDFNEWVLKNASTRDPFSYVWTPEYEIFEFDLAGTFNYAEMAALICPRPFMVERGHFDGVAIDPWVAFEYAKVRYLYAAKLGIPERTEIEWFPGPHTINGEATFDFLRKHLLE